ncbi:MAG: hypothetical protein K1W35_16545 [Lachnospiraceae bacterium]
MFRERACHPMGQSAGFSQWEAPAVCQGSRNEMLSPEKGIPSMAYARRQQ